MSNEINNLYTFDEYVLNVKERNLWQNNELVPLSTKVFDTLFMLVESHGEVVKKEEMLATIWGDIFVEENNLSQKISILRKTFGKDKKFIETVPRKGFRFVEEVKIISDVNFKKLNKSVEKNESKVAETIEHSSKPDNLYKNQTIETSYFFQQRPLLLTLAFVVFISFSFAGYSYYNTQIVTSDESKTLEISALTDTGDIRFPSISPDGKSLAYTKPNDSNIFIKNVETGNEAKIRIEDSLVAGFTRFSPDGIYLYFRTRKRRTDTADIYRVPTYGGTAELITQDAWGLFEISPDGDKIVFIKENREQRRFDLTVKNIYSKTEEVLISKDSPQSFFDSDPPSWSADGKRITIVQLEASGSLGSLLIIDVATKKEQIVKLEGVKSIYETLWLPSNKELLIIATTQKAIDQIFKVDIPSGEISRLTNDLKKYRELSISQDGKKVVARSHNIYANIWILPKGDIARKKQITEGSKGLAGLFGIGWTTNDKIVHYQLGDNESQIRIIDPTDKSGRLLAQNTNGVSQYPKVSPNGKTVFFSIYCKRQNKN